ncbi:hypothetical protein SCLCIDRAFT_1219200 [Scleroderma citrinum Foug A]|uniref:Uncharacterized protein n=1 Tax=Scleroderma citrinum Foug A TaxID=1036808 RepID=A0A0C2Z6T8_9AGAM|nr:hypothetical protein SCLCIDRAFT_1219200 [Scleroderma citrinum Foug A]
MTGPTITTKCQQLCTNTETTTEVNGKTPPPPAPTIMTITIASINPRYNCHHYII